MLKRLKNYVYVMFISDTAVNRVITTNQILCQQNKY